MSNSTDLQEKNSAQNDDELSGLGKLINKSDYMLAELSRVNNETSHIHEI
jgi:hypothetical protein